MRAVSVLVVALLALSSPALAAVATGPSADATPPEQSTPSSLQTMAGNETSNRLPIEGDVTRTYISPSFDLGTTLDGQDEQLRSEFDIYVLESRLDERSEQERIALLENATRKLDDQIDALEQREREAVRRHANGEISDGALLRTMVQNYRRSLELERVLETVDEQADRTSGFSLSTRTYEVRLNGHQSPVRERLERTSSGLARADGSPEIIYVETAENGFMLSTIDNDRYVREATRYDNRDQSRSDRFDEISDVQDRVYELYPWVFDNDEHNLVPTYVPYYSLQLYTVDVSHPQGELAFMLDGGTGNTFREVQTLSVEDLPAERVGTWRNESLVLSINATPAHGPIQVTVTDNESDTPVDATIVVDDTVIGDTGSDGHLWLIPPSEDYEVTARTDDGSVNASVAVTG